MKIRKRLLIVVIALGAATTTTTSLFAGGSNLDAGSKDRSASGVSSCSGRLRQAMDDMHRQMHSVESSGDVDEDFVRLMLPHHEAAIEMAKVELLCGKDAVNRRLAQEIITDQQSEIELMRLWLAKHGSRKPAQTGRGGEVRP